MAQWGNFQRENKKIFINKGALLVDLFRQSIGGYKENSSVPGELFDKLQAIFLRRRLSPYSYASVHDAINDLQALNIFFSSMRLPENSKRYMAAVVDDLEFDPSDIRRKFCLQFIVSYYINFFKRQYLDIDDNLEEKKYAENETTLIYTFREIISDSIKSVLEFDLVDLSVRYDFLLLAIFLPQDQFAEILIRFNEVFGCEFLASFFKKINDLYYNNLIKHEVVILSNNPEDYDENGFSVLSVDEDVLIHRALNLDIFADYDKDMLQSLALDCVQNLLDISYEDLQFKFPVISTKIFKTLHKYINNFTDLDLRLVDFTGLDLQACEFYTSYIEFNQLDQAIWNGYIYKWFELNISKNYDCIPSQSFLFEHIIKNLKDKEVIEWLNGGLQPDCKDGYAFLINRMLDYSFREKLIEVFLSGSLDWLVNFIQAFVMSIIRRCLIYYNNIPEYIRADLIKSACYLSTDCFLWYLDFIYGMDGSDVEMIYGLKFIREFYQASGPDGFLSQSIDIFIDDNVAPVLDEKIAYCLLEHKDTAWRKRQVGEGFFLCEQERNYINFSQSVFEFLISKGFKNFRRMSLDGFDLCEQSLSGLLLKGATFEDTVFFNQEKIWFESGLHYFIKDIPDDIFEWVHRALEFDSWEAIGVLIDNDVGDMDREALIANMIQTKLSVINYESIIPAGLKNSYILLAITQSESEFLWSLDFLYGQFEWENYQLFYALKFINDLYFNYPYMFVESELYMHDIMHLDKLYSADRVYYIQDVIQRKIHLGQDDLVESKVELQLASSASWRERLPRQYNLINMTAEIFIKLWELGFRNFSGVNFLNCDLSGLDLRGGIFDNDGLVGAVLKDTIFTDCELSLWCKSGMFKYPEARYDEMFSEPTRWLEVAIDRKDYLAVCVLLEDIDQEDYWKDTLFHVNILPDDCEFKNQVMKFILDLHPKLFTCVRNDVYKKYFNPENYFNFNNFINRCNSDFQLLDICLSNFPDLFLKKLADGRSIYQYALTSDEPACKQIIKREQVAEYILDKFARIYNGLRAAQSGLKWFSFLDNLQGSAYEKIEQIRNHAYNDKAFFGGDNRTNKAWSLLLESIDLFDLDVSEDSKLVDDIFIYGNRYAMFWCGSCSKSTVNDKIMIELTR